jgi:hypothetical protein
VDEGRELYARWGLGVGTTWHVLNPRTGWSMLRLGKEEGVWGREVLDGAGNRWQVAGSWAMDGWGVVRWGGPAGAADEVADLEEGVRAIAGSGR